MIANGLLRTFRKNVGFSIAVIAMLGIGIGATTTIFSVADGVLFAPLPVANEPRLMAIVNTGTRPGDYISLLDFLDVRASVKSFDEAAAYYEGPATLTGDGDPRRVGYADVTANWFSMLGVGVQLGRTFAPGEDGANAAKIVIISDALWRTRFGHDSNILGREIAIDGEQHTIVGVAVPKMAFPRKFDFWRPLRISGNSLLPRRRGNRLYQSVVRIEPGVSVERAQAEFAAVANGLRERYPEAETGLRFDLMPMRQHMVGDSRATLLVLVAAVVCVLLIACANVASLMLLRARQRTHEIGIRLALGASPGRVVREMLSESAAYGVAGGVVGIIIAEISVRAVVALQPGGLIFLEDVAVDARVLAFAVLVTLATSMLFGVAPAIFASKTNLLTTLTSSSRSTSAGKQGAWLRQAFVVLELALALVLLVGVGLFGKSFQRLTSVDVGFKAEGLVRFDMLVPDRPDPSAKTRIDSTARMRAFVNQLVSDLHTVPGATAVGAGFGAPFTGPAMNETTIHIDGHAPESADRPNVSLWKSVTPGYFETLGVPLIRGRVFNNQDRAQATRAAIVNQAFVKAYLAGEEPIGKTISNHGEIVGVVGDTKNASLAESPQPAVYYAIDQDAVGYITVLIRTSADPAIVLAAARKRLALLDNTLPTFDGGTYDALVRTTTAQSRISLQMIAGFSAFALLLAGAGIYSVVAFAVRQRQREFGVRVALGAQRRQIIGLVLGQGTRLVAFGLALGLTGATVASAEIRSQLYNVAATDALSYAAACGVLIIATLAASLLPALHASRVDPMIAMRAE